MLRPAPGDIRYGDQTEPLAIAHRGGAALAPENTLEAFDRSYGLGLRYLETDVRITADGQLVAFHDATLRRVTGARGAVSARALAELRRLRVLGGGGIPTLGEVLARFPDARVTVDLKQSAALEPLAQLLADSGAAGRVCVAGSWDRSLTELRERVGPELTIALGWRALATMLTRLRTRPGRLTFAPGTFAHVPLRLGRVGIVHDELAERAHDIGVRLIVWTVNDADTMHRLLDAGADGIITDRPDRLREVLLARGQWRPPAPVREPEADTPA